VKKQEEWILEIYKLVEMTSKQTITPTADKSAGYVWLDTKP
jgi:hypothetical protein